MDKAFRSMRRLRAHDIIACRDFYYSYLLYTEELKLARGAGYFARLWDCFAVPRIRRSNYGASTVMIAQQMCGINSKSLLVSRCCLALTSCSHLFLQFNYLLGRWLYRGSVIVRVSGLRCHPGRVNDPHFVPHRHQRAKNPDLGCESFQASHTAITDRFPFKTFPGMCIFLLAAGLSLLKKEGSKGERIGPVVL